MSKLVPVPIVPPPGVVKTESDRVIEGRWTHVQGVRFVKGRPQKIGGNTRSVVTQTTGAPRCIHAWRDNAFNNFMGAGTYKKLYVYDSSWLQNDITPFVSTGVLAANPFATTNGSPIVTVTDTAHGVNIGDTVIFTGATSVGGLSMNGIGFIVASVISVNSYTFTHVSNATSTATGGGGAVAYDYEIPIGVEIGAYGYGWGVGGWGLGTWGTARDVSTLYIEPRIWSLDHFGKFLVATYNGGTVYIFDPTQIQPWPRAQLMSSDPELPTDCRAMVVTPERYIMVLRLDMSVSWCAQGDYTVWTPATDNDANTRTLTVGTKLIGARVLAPFITLVWSDAALYRFQWTGSTYVYDSSMVGVSCGLVSPNAAVTVSGVAYWMGPDQFWMYAGSVQPIPNVEDIRRYVFDDLRENTVYQANATYNAQFNEVVFHYTPEGFVTPQKTVVYHINDQCWSIGSGTRVSGTYFTQGDTRPYFGDSDGFIYQHEVGLNDNGAALPYTLTLAPLALQDGATSIDVQGFTWDFFDQQAAISVEIEGWDYLDDADPMDTDSDVLATSGRGRSDVRVSGRYIGFTLSCEELDSYMRMGKPVAWVKAAGGRS